MEYDFFKVKIPASLSTPREFVLDCLYFHELKSILKGDVNHKFLLAVPPSGDFLATPLQPSNLRSWAGMAHVVD